MTITVSLFRFFLFSVFAVLFLPSARAQESPAIDVLHYRFEIGLTDATDAITGSAIIDVQFLRDASEVSFDLASVEDDKGMYAFQVKTENKLVASNHFENKLRITLPAIAHKGDKRTFVISYMGTPKDGLIIGQNKYGDRTFFSDNWPDRAHQWIPCIDRPDDKASFEFRVTAPNHYKIISNGTLVKDSSMGQQHMVWWKEDKPQPTKVMVIGVARFAIKTFDEHPSGIPVSAWVFPQDSAKGFYDYAVAPKIVNFLQQYIGPFPYKKLANVQSKTIFGGMENASAIFYAEESVTGTRKWQDVIAHEIAHQWFGDMASEKSFAHLWLSEGFATYFENLYISNEFGVDSAAKRWAQDRVVVSDYTRTSTTAVVDSTSDLMSLLNPNSYQKGGWVLRMLQHQLSDSVFQKVIRTYYAKYAGSNADTYDFIRVADSVSGKNLNDFFQQWLFRPGIPHLSITVSKEKEEAVVTILQSGPVFQFPFEFLVTSGDGTERIEKVEVSQLRTVVRFKGKQPMHIITDPGTWLLYDAK